MENEIQQNIINHIEKQLNIKTVGVEIPPQGMSSKVFFITGEDGTEIAVKYGKDAINDISALQLIQKEKINIAVPKIYGYFKFENTSVILLERIKYPLLDSIPVNQMHNIYHQW